MGTLSKGTGAVAGISQRQGRYKRSAPAFLIILAALVLLLGFSMILSVCTGIAGGSFKAFAETVMYPAKASGVGMIMLEMRMPRALAAGLTGMAFALSGAVMQGITRTPCQTPVFWGSMREPASLLHCPQFCFPPHQTS